MINELTKQTVFADMLQFFPSKWYFQLLPPAAQAICMLSSKYR